MVPIDPAQRRLPCFRLSAFDTQSSSTQSHPSVFPNGPNTLTCIYTLA